MELEDCFDFVAFYLDDKFEINFTKSLKWTDNFFMVMLPMESKHGGLHSV